jgi:hypothetical protein
VKASARAIAEAEAEALSTKVHRREQRPADHSRQSFSALLFADDRG